MDRNEVADLLEKAADLYESEQVEWCQGVWANKYSGGRLSVCAEGAIYLAAGVQSEWLLGNSPHAALEAFSLGEIVIKAVTSVTVPRHGASLHVWNDSPGTTKAEVIELMKERAKDLRNGPQALPIL